MMQSSAKELFQLMKEISVSPSTESTISKQKEFAQHGFKSAMSSASEMVEMVAKSQVELFDIIGKRVTENFEEVCNTAPAKKKSA
jgi:phasin family protein